MATSGTDSGTGPASLVLMASVARRFYVDEVSKSDIAEEFSLSRFKVARLLEQARSSGLVRIEIDVAGGLDVELSGRLQRAYGLQHAIVVDTAAEDGPARRGRRGERRHQRLGQAGIIGPGGQRPWSRRRLGPGRVIDHDQV